VCGLSRQHRGKRSRAEIERRLVLLLAYRDRIIKETVARFNDDEAVIDDIKIQRYVNGEVLIDTLYRGSIQQPIEQPPKPEVFINKRARYPLLQGF
jgi:hypothetical protein